MSAPLLAQTISSKKCDGVMFAPEKGQWQISVFMGGGNKYNANQDYRLLPNFTNTSGSVGVGQPNGDLTGILNISGLNGNNLTNILGFEAKYFVSDCWDINMQFSMDINLTPGKDYVEGDYSVPDMIIPAQDYLGLDKEARINFPSTLGENWTWRINSHMFTKAVVKKIYALTNISDRLSYVQEVK